MGFEGLARRRGRIARPDDEDPTPQMGLERIRLADHFERLLEWDVMEAQRDTAGLVEGLVVGDEPETLCGADLLDHREEGLVVGLERYVRNLFLVGTRNGRPDEKT
jgi:hypothetical protein